MSLKNQIQDFATEIFDSVITQRRHIHAHPELSFEEKETAAFVNQRLQQLGIETETDIAGHGLVGYIRGTKTAPEGVASKVLALRADMDALPIVEENEVPYRSQNQGVMHACGHDVHTSSLLGTAQVLQHFREHFSGTIKLIFQPAEERAPGGASLMIQEGVLKQPQPVNGILGQHVQPYFPCGKIGVRSGIYMASADEIYLEIKGKGGHAAHPAHFIDPVMITAQMLVALQQVVSRSDPRIPSVLSFGKINSDGGATNIIPERVWVHGTFRTMNEPWREKALQKIKDIALSTARGLGGDVDVNIVRGYPVLTNEPQLTMRTRDRITDYVGEENIIDMDLWMAAEDFAFYTHEVPGCFYRLGTRNEEKGIVHGLHTPLFNIDEEAMRLSTGLMAWLAIQEVG